MRPYTLRRCLALAAALMSPLAAIDADAATAAGPTRIRVVGEIVDSWCQVSKIMGTGIGTAHHQCAIWCAVGGIPVGIQGEDGKLYILLKVEASSDVVANPTIVDIQTDKVVADADWYERDGVNYLVVTKIVNDEGIVDKNHQDLGILPFGE
jgi:hypothetical protein